MAATPLRYIPKNPTPAKGTHPSWTQSQSWYIRWSKLDNPLTRQQTKALRDCFGTANEDMDKRLRQLKRDWKKISAVAQYVAMASHTQDETKKLFFGKAMKRARDRQLRAAIRASETAANAVEEMTQLWSPLVSTGGLQRVRKQFELLDWADAVIAKLADERKAMEHHGTLPTAKLKTGRPEEPETHRLQILASYFRYRRWGVSSKIDGLFSQTCSAVLHSTLDPINPERLKAVVNSDYSYDALLPLADTNRSSRALVGGVTLRGFKSKK